jgi:cbb3-type cytochrome oxidase maturation protein
MEWVFYTLAFLIAATLTGTAVYALYWSSRHGQLRDFERGASSIFDQEEPVGQMTDHFPVKRQKPQTGVPEAESGKRSAKTK